MLRAVATSARPPEGGTMKQRKRKLVVRAGIAVGLGAAVGSVGGRPRAAASRGHDGHVFAISNDPAGNALLAFDRAADGTLTAAPSVATGGTGTGSGLGSQGAGGRRRQRPRRAGCQPRLGPGVAVRRARRRARPRRHRVEWRRPPDLGRPSTVGTCTSSTPVPATTSRACASATMGLDPVPGSTQPLSQPDAGGGAGRLHAERAPPRRDRALHQPHRHVPCAPRRGRAGRRQPFDWA